MKIVIDTNALMAGLIKNSLVREILISKNINFFLPDYAMQEIKKYSDYLCDKINCSKEELGTLFSLLLENIKIVPGVKIKPFMEETSKLMKNIDINDSSFIAICLAINADGIWSFDKHFQQQNKIKLFTIKDLINHI